MTELITVPTFTFSQGNIWEGAEMPIQVSYYNGGKDDEKMVELRQENDEVLINVGNLRKLLREIERHLPAATVKLNEKY